MKVKGIETIVTRILVELSERGFRVTAARREVVRAFAQSPIPQTIRDLAQRVSADEVSVYRTVALLVENKMVEVIEGMGETKRYSLYPGTHHHHIVCTKCGYTAHIPCDEVERARVSHPTFSSIMRHSVTYYGQCRSCTIIRHSV